MSGKLVTITPEGIETVQAISTRMPQYEQLSDAVGGLIQPVKVRYEGRVREAYVNEEGFMQRLAVNRRARRLVADYWNKPVEAVQEFVGSMVIWVPDPRA